MDRRRLVRDYLVRRAARARISSTDFFEFVIREETTRARIKTLPHQALVLAFIEHHDQCLIKLPVGFTKTYLMTALTLYQLGLDPTARGAVISATQGQASKPVGMVRDYIENSAELRLVFPELRPSPREGDKWTQQALVVDRPPGIRDPSLVAVGVEGALPGARLSWLFVDDILDDENTATPAGRAKVKRWFWNTVMGRRDVQGAKVVVTNTPWHPEDLVHDLQRAGWPTLEMTVDGEVRIYNAPDFDTDAVRPADPESTDPEAHLRLAAHDDPELVQRVYEEEGLRPPMSLTDEECVVPLWPSKFGNADIRRIEREYQRSGRSVDFEQLYRMRCRSDEDSRVKEADIAECKRLAREAGHFGLTAAWDNEWPVYTGVDLGVGKSQSSGKTVLFTFAIRPEDRRRLILDVDAGKWSGKTIVKKIGQKHRRYGSLIAVENNGAQDYLRQWMVEEDSGIPIRAHLTGKNKVNPAFGVESIFIEIENHLWLIPSDPGGGVHPKLQEWLDDMLYYVAGKHTGDFLMSCWIGREYARKMGAFVKPPPGHQPSVAAQIGMR